MISCVAHGHLARAKSAPNLLGCVACSSFAWVHEGMLLVWVDGWGSRPMWAPHRLMAVAEAA